MENQMLCYQCESAADGKFCNGMVGECGKTAETSSLQDALTGALIGLAKASAHKSIDEEIQWLMIEGLCATMSHANFDDQKIRAINNKVQAAKNKFIPKFGDYNTSIKIPEDFDIRLIWQKSPDIRSLKSLLLFGIRGIATYAYQSWVLGYKNKEAATFFHKALIALSENHFKDDYFDLINEMGDVNLRAMELLINANNDTYGQPSPVDVPRIIDPGPFIVVSGHNYKDLEMILDQTANTGINVYSHCEMLPAHAYPKFREYPHFKGHYGTGWQNQHAEFDNIPAAIVFTTNCIVTPLPSYADRVFTTGTAGLPGIPHIEDNDFRPVLIRSIELNGAPSAITFPGTNGGDTVKTGFGKKSQQTLGYKIAGAMADGDINHIFVIGGCDGFGDDRQFFTDIIHRIPADSVVLTYGCCKFRFNDIENKEIGGVPKIIDAGQCGDLLNVIETVEAIAASAKCRVEELPLTWLLSWQEQRSISNLFSLFAADVQNVIFGPKLPPFITQNVFDVYAKEFHVSTLIRDEQEEDEERQEDITIEIEEEIEEPVSAESARTTEETEPLALADHEKAALPVEVEPAYKEKETAEPITEEPDYTRAEAAVPETYNAYQEPEDANEYIEYEELTEESPSVSAEPLFDLTDIALEEENAPSPYTPEEVEDRSEAAGLPDWAISDDDEEEEETEETENIAVVQEKPKIRPEDIDQTPSFLLGDDDDVEEDESTTADMAEDTETAAPVLEKPKIRPEDIDQTPSFLLENDEEKATTETAEEEPSLFIEKSKDGDESAASVKSKATKTKKTTKSAKATKKTATETKKEKKEPEVKAEKAPEKAAQNKGKGKGTKDTAPPKETTSEKKTTKKKSTVKDASSTDTTPKPAKNTAVSERKDEESTFDLNHKKANTPQKAAELKEIEQPPKLELPKGAGVSGIKDSEETLAAAKKEPYRYQPPQELKEIPKAPPVKLPKGAGVSGMKDSSDTAKPATAPTQEPTAKSDQKTVSAPVEQTPVPIETITPQSVTATKTTAKEDAKPSAEAQNEPASTQTSGLGIPKGKGVSGWQDPDENPAFDRNAPKKPYQYTPPQELKEIPKAPPIPLPAGAGVSGFSQGQPKESNPSPIKNMYSFAESKPEIRIPKGKGVSGWQETDAFSMTTKKRKSDDENGSAKPWLENSLKELKASIAEDNEIPVATAPVAETPVPEVPLPKTTATAPAAVAEEIPSPQKEEVPPEPILNAEERNSKPWLENSLQELKASIAEEESEKAAAGTKPWLAASLQQLKESLKEDGIEPVSEEIPATQAAQEVPTAEESAPAPEEVPAETWHKPAVQPKSWQDIVPATEPPAKSAPAKPPVKESVDEPSGSEPITETWQKPQVQPKPWDRDLQTTWQKPQVMSRPWAQQQQAEFQTSEQAPPPQYYTQLPNLPLGTQTHGSGMSSETTQSPMDPNPYRYVERREAPPEIPIGSGTSGYREPSYVPGQAPPPQNDTPTELREIQQPAPMHIPLGRGVSGVRFHEEETPIVPSYDPTYYDVPQKTPKINLPKGVGTSGWQDGEAPIDPAEAIRQQSAAEKQGFTANDLLVLGDTDTPGNDNEKVYRPNEGEELIATLGPDGKVILAVRDKNNNR